MDKNYGYYRCRTGAWVHRQGRNTPVHSRTTLEEQLEYGMTLLSLQGIRSRTTLPTMEEQLHSERKALSPSQEMPFMITMLISVEEPLQF